MDETMRSLIFLMNVRVLGCDYFEGVKCFILLFRVSFYFLSRSQLGSFESSFLDFLTFLFHASLELLLLSNLHEE